MSSTCLNKHSYLSTEYIVLHTDLKIQWRKTWEIWGLLCCWINSVDAQTQKLFSLFSSQSKIVWVNKWRAAFWGIIKFYSSAAFLCLAEWRLRKGWLVSTRTWSGCKFLPLSGKSYSWLAKTTISWLLWPGDQLPLYLVEIVQCPRGGRVKDCWPSENASLKDSLSRSREGFLGGLVLRG